MTIDEVREILRRTPDVLRSMLAGLSEPWVRTTEGPGTWSAFDVAGHLIHADRTNWVPRIRAVLAGQGTFAPFDREAMLAANAGRPMGDLLDEFDVVRVESLSVLDFPDDDLSKTGRHPELGEVTLGQLLAAWAAHDLDHLHQITRVLARRLKADVGPWSRYLRVLPS